jgi:catechol 2,3-dioxygenase-like lactoylglutathione lyase family enzyme
MLTQNTIARRRIENGYPWNCAVQARRIGHAVLETPDLQRQLDYYTGILGFSLATGAKHEAFLASRSGQLAIHLRQGEAARCTALSFEVAASTNFTAVAKVLAAKGVACQLRSDHAPGIDELLSFSDPKGTRIELFKNWAPIGDAKRVNGISPLKFGHVAFSVPDVRAVVDFYKGILGFRESDWIEDHFAFLRCNPDHHTVNFLRGQTGRMHHIAFELQDAAHIARACDLLGQNRIKVIWGPGRHSVGHNLFAYHRDPDGHVIELFAELDQMKDEALGYFEARPWHQDFPQWPRVWLQEESLSWGLPPTPDFRRQREEG